MTRTRRHIENAIKARHPTPGFVLWTDTLVTELAGYLLSTVFRGGLRDLDDAQATISRVRTLCRHHGDTGTVPVRDVLDILYGEPR